MARSLRQESPSRLNFPPPPPSRPSIPDHCFGHLSLVSSLAVWYLNEATERKVSGSHSPDVVDYELPRSLRLAS